jgi:hypothetical protein
MVENAQSVAEYYVKFSHIFKSEGLLVHKKLNRSSNGVLLEGVAKPTKRYIVNRNFGLERPLFPRL